MLNELNKIGLQMNLNKTKVMCSGKIHYIDIMEHLVYVTYALAKIGQRKSYHRNLSQKVTSVDCIWAARKHYEKQEYTSKLCLINQCIPPVLTYGYHTWSIMKQSIKKQLSQDQWRAKC